MSKKAFGGALSKLRHAVPHGGVTGPSRRRDGSIDVKELSRVLHCKAMAVASLSVLLKWCFVSRTVMARFEACHDSDITPVMVVP